MNRTVSLEQQSRHATVMVQDAEWLRLNLGEHYRELESHIIEVMCAALVAREQIEGNQPKSYEHTTFTTALWRLRNMLHDIASGSSETDNWLMVCAPQVDASGGASSTAVGPFVSLHRSGRRGWPKA